ncbi:hypothetical protein QFC22_000758 [Naganishia vaughanmartiniae]|uniref:Uncharacterized protein n=1 Tax=Naganishia vaughanmartiniae TaxID=1424756 RepID=A0ACC2XJ28_9TREE|nr:hypothetical protein QFC22_000758 [Naganishia vaughanmartiniae]
MQNYKNRALKSASSSESDNSQVRPSHLNRTDTDSTTSSFGWETVRDIQKTYTLIKFSGCQTHHDMLVALRMLIPYQTTCSEHEDRHVTYDNNAERGGGHPIRYKSADARVVEKVMADVLDLYIETKISRRKKAKNLKQGRMDVGEKLKVLEKEFYENTSLLRVFDRARSRHDLPPRADGLHFTSGDSQSSSPSTRNISALGEQPTINRSRNLPSENKRTPGNFRGRATLTPMVDGALIHQEGIDLGSQSLHLHDPARTSSEDIARQPHARRHIEANLKRGQEHDSHAHVEYPPIQSGSQTTLPKFSNHCPASTTSTSAALKHFPPASCNFEGLHELPSRHETHPSTKARLSSERLTKRTLPKGRTANDSSAPAEPKQTWRETSLDLDSDDEMADQLFWKDEMKMNDSVTLPVINYSRPRRVTLGRSDSSDLPLTMLADVTRSGSARLPSGYHPELAKSALSYDALDRTGRRQSVSPVDWELSAFSDEVAEQDVILPSTDDHIDHATPFQNQLVQERRPRDIATQTFDSRGFHKGMSFAGNVGTRVHHDTARRESAVWNVD